MLDEKGFDNWSGNYDQDILKHQNSYPFAGYYDLFGRIETCVGKLQQPRVLELGIGTGTLSKVLQDNGALITGVDYSQQMLEESKKKMGMVDLYQQDLTLGLPECLSGQKYDFIVSTYALHHIPNTLKAMYFRHLTDYLSPIGVLLIGDVSFETQRDFSACKADAGHSWDLDVAEHYFIYEHFHAHLDRTYLVEYDQLTFCTGLLKLRKRS